MPQKGRPSEVERLYPKRKEVDEILKNLSQSATDRGQILKEAVERYSHELSDQDQETFFEEFEVPGTGKVTMCAQAVLERLLYLNESVDDFYEHLAEAILDSVTFNDENARAKALSYLLCEPRLPYRHYDTFEIDYNKYARTLRQQEERIHELGVLLFRPFKSYVDQATAMLSVLDSVEDERTRAVLFSSVLYGLFEPDDD